MSAKEALIRAYNFFSSSAESGGDFDLGARGTHDPVRRIPRGRYTDPMHAKESGSRAINTSGIICAALEGAKIIQAAEGKRPEQGAYSRIVYGTPIKGDTMILAAHLCDTIERGEKGRAEDSVRSEVQRLDKIVLGAVGMHLRKMLDHTLKMP